MTSVSIFEAKTNLSKYVAAVSSKQEEYVIIVRNGKPVAKLVPYENETGSRIGVARGCLPMMPSLEAFNSIDTSSDFYGDGGSI